MTGIHRLKHIQCFCSSYFPDNDPLRPQDKKEKKPTPQS